MYVLRRHLRFLHPLGSVRRLPDRVITHSNGSGIVCKSLYSFIPNLNYRCSSSGCVTAKDSCSSPNCCDRYATNCAMLNKFPFVTGPCREVTKLFSIYSTVTVSVTMLQALDSRKRSSMCTLDCCVDSIQKLEKSACDQSIIYHVNIMYIGVTSMT